MTSNTAPDNRVVGTDGRIEQELTAFVEATMWALEKSVDSEEVVDTVEATAESLTDLLDQTTMSEVTRAEFEHLKRVIAIQGERIAKLEREKRENEPEDTTTPVDGEQDVGSEENEDTLGSEEAPTEDRPEDGTAAEEDQDDGGDEQDDLHERVADLETESDLHFEDICDLEATTRNLEERVSALEDGSSTDQPDSSDGEETDPTAHIEPQTALEDAARLPTRLTDDETANVRRALFVARDVMDYTSSVPAGRVIRWSELRKVLQAADHNTHPETIRRVMDILADLGEDTVRVVDKPNQERLVCFEEDAARRLDELCSQDQPTDESHSVVSPTGG